MTVRLHVRAARRIQPVRMVSHPSAFTSREYAIVDDHREGADAMTITPELHPTATVRLLKTYISSRAHLRVLGVPSTLRVESPSGGVLVRDGHYADIRVSAPTPASDIETASLLVYVDPPDVPSQALVYALTVKILRARRLRVALHVGTRAAPYFDAANAIAIANRVWAQAGIELVPVSQTPVVEPTPDPRGYWFANVAELQRRSFDATALNIYVVGALPPYLEPSNDAPDGMTYDSGHRTVANGDFRPCIVVSPEVASMLGPSDPGLLVAHELGHFLGLRHPHDPVLQQPVSSVLLMHNLAPSGWIIPVSPASSAFANLNMNLNGLETARNGTAALSSIQLP